MARVRPTKQGPVGLFRALAALAVTCLAAYLFLNSSLFAIRSVVVSGNSILSEQEIVSLSGTTLGGNILRLNPGRAAANLRTSPLIKEVQVERHLPAKVLIRVTEKTPAAAVAAGNAFALIDGNGLVLAAVDELTRVDLPLLNGALESPKPLPGELLTGPGSQVGLLVVGAMPPDLAANVAEVEVRSPEDVWLYTKDGRRVRLGGPEVLDKKLAAAAELVGQAASWRVVASSPQAYYDLSRGRPLLVAQLPAVPPE